MIFLVIELGEEEVVKPSGPAVFVLPEAEARQLLYVLGPGAHPFEHLLFFLRAQLLRKLEENHVLNRTTHSSSFLIENVPEAFVMA